MIKLKKMLNNINIQKLICNKIIINYKLIKL